MHTNLDFVNNIQQIIHYLGKFRNALDKKMFTCGVFIDLERAFDKVNHQILLSKLYHYGIRGVANIWLTFCLTGRSQSVILNEVTSSTRNVRCGVPQGSKFGPTSLSSLCK
jgi:hypothetical protein